jgi:hypothetical protein
MRVLLELPDHKITKRILGIGMFRGSSVVLKIELVTTDSRGASRHYHGLISGRSRSIPPPFEQPRDMYPSKRQQEGVGCL